MIYFDNAATTWPKPDNVITAMQECLIKTGANPGRGGHKMSLAAGRIILATRENLAKLFNVDNPMQIVLTHNATESLNLAIKGLLVPGDHVITTSMEHNSVVRPLHVMEQKGVEVTKIQANAQGEIQAADIIAAIRPNTKAVVMTHASNVTGTLMPIQEVGKATSSKGVKFIVDAAQTAGVYPIDVQQMNIDLLAFPGHKGLLGPQGTGGLYISPDVQLTPLTQGGTGSNSELLEQPEIIPDRFESGTLNTVGYAGLNAGLEYIFQVGLDEIRKQEERLTQAFISGIKTLDKIEAYGPLEITKQASVVSINLKDNDSSELGFVLDRIFDMGCRAGLHCAPDAHKTIGTFERGTVRFSFGYFNTMDEVEQAIEALAKISQEM